MEEKSVNEAGNTSKKRNSLNQDNFTFQDGGTNSDSYRNIGPGSPSWNRKRFDSSNLSDLGGGVKGYQKDELILEKSKTNTSQYYKRRKSLITKVRNNLLD